MTLGLGVQVATVILTGIILIPIIVLNAADHPEGLEWAAFAVLVVSGLATILQAVSIHRARLTARPGEAVARSR